MSIHHQRGGYARAAALTPERRAEIARMGGAAKAARREAALAMHAQIVQRIQDGISEAKRKGVSFNSLVFWPLHGETLFTVRASPADALAIGVLAMRAFQAAGLDAVIHLRTAGTYCEVTIHRAAPVETTSEVHDDPV